MIDGFDHYTQTELNNDAKWDAHSGSVSIVSGIGKGGTQACRFGTWNSVLIKTGFSTSIFNPINIGLRRKISVLPPSQVIVFDLTDDTGDVYLRLEQTTTGALVLKSNSGSVLGTSSVVAAGSYAYIELALDIGTSIVLKINEVEQINVSGAIAFPAGAFDRVTINSSSNVGSAVSLDIDDVYVDTNGFYGNSHVETVYPVANGSLQEWLNTIGAASAFQSVNQVLPDSDTTYRSTDELTKSDNFLVGQTTATAIKAVQNNVLARKDEACYKVIVPTINSSIGPQLCLSQTYQYAMYYSYYDPDTFINWVVADFNLSEFGYQTVQQCGCS